MMTNLSNNDLISQVNQLLDDLIPQSKLGTNLEESMQYSINAGGKRVRPLLLLLTLDMLNK
ncbi:polyprenyl synthetase family protein, partial [Staphylococcus capitis]